jgi:hypothetical protein
VKNSAPIFCLLLLLSAGIASRAQTTCATANENALLTITAPAGYKFTTVDFASYGTPNGSCGSFTTSSCHSATSLSVCTAAIVGRTTASISASNGVFGDPCVGTVKRLYVQATYSVILPLTLVSFRFEEVDEKQVKLVWVTADEADTKEFVVEESNDGVEFKQTGRTPAIGRGGKKYIFTVETGAAPIYYFRLKMIDIDGQFKYSQIIRYSGDEQQAGVSYDISGRIYIASNELQQAILFSSNGQLLRKITLKPGRQMLPANELRSGMYFLKTSSATLKIIKH